jgi:hypothetical protein
MTEKAKSRLNLRVPSELMEWVKRFAQQRNTTVTQLVVDYFTREKLLEEGGHRKRRG